MSGTNIFGPHGAGINPSTERIAKTDSNSNVDTWFGPCINGDPNTGTKIGQDWLNFMTANMREAVRGMGVPESETDDELLLKAIQAAQTDLSVLLNLPFYPHVENSTGKFACTGATGSFFIQAGTTFLHRGHKRYTTNSSDFSAAARTFATLANKTYHLRWYAPGHALAPANTYPKGRFMLRDLADAAYNPGGANEYDEAFDTTYDDMLIAKVATNSGNAQTFTQLANKVSLFYQSDAVGGVPTANSADNASSLIAQFVFNFARKPTVSYWRAQANTLLPPGEDGAPDHDEQTNLIYLSRYSCNIQALRDYSDYITVSLSAVA